MQSEITAALSIITNHSSEETIKLQKDFMLAALNRVTKDDTVHSFTDAKILKFSWYPILLHF